MLSLVIPIKSNPNISFFTARYTIDPPTHSVKTNVWFCVAQDEESIQLWHDLSFFEILHLTHQQDRNVDSVLLTL